MTVRITESTLLEIPLFAGLSAAEVAGLPTHASIEEHRRGTYLFRRGDAGECLYVVLAGQIALELASNDVQQLLALCGPGGWFGELALLTAQPRSADARVAVDSRLLRIDREGWSAISERAPQLFARLCERLGDQLRATNERARRARRAVIACGEADPSSPPWAPSLVESLRRQFPRREVHLVGSGGTAGRGRMAAALRRRDRAALEAALAQLVAPDALLLIPAGAADLADRRLRRAGPMEWVLEPGRHGDHERIRGASPEAALDRVARHVAEGTIGLALGAGGAFGFAQLGMLQVFAAAGIPVDYVAGTSMGAVLGGLFAARVPLDAMVEMAVDIASRYRGIVLRDLDYLRGRALLSGSGVMQVIGQFPEARRATFESLDVPFVAVAMDVAAGDEVVIDSGPLLDGIRPSFAIPGIFPACERGTGVLIDGAMVNPLPVDRARDLGADVVIASQPIPPLQPSVADPLGAFLGRARWLGDVWPLQPLRGWMQTLNLSLRSYQALWYRLAVASALTADVSLSPELRDFWFLQFGAAARIIETGRQSTEAALPAIRRLLAQRVGWGGESPPAGARQARARAT